MPDVTINREISTDEVSQAVRKAMGDGVSVEPHGDRLLVHEGFWKRAMVQSRPGNASTTVTVAGAGPPGLLAFVIGKLLNERNFAPRVADALRRELG